MGEATSRSYESQKPQETARALEELEAKLGVKKNLGQETLQAKLEILDNLTDDLSKKFEEKIEAYAGGKEKVDALRALAKTDPKAFATQMSVVLDKVMADSEIQKILSKIQLTNPESLGKFEAYISDVKFYLNEKFTGLKTAGVDSFDDFKEGLSSVNGDKLASLNYSGALTMGATTGFAFLFCEQGLGKTIKWAGIAAAVGSNDALAPLVLKTVQTGFEGIGKMGKGVFGILNEMADGIASGKLLGLDKISQAEKLKFYETIEGGVKHFPLHIQHIWKKMLIEKKGGKIEKSAVIQDSDIRKSAYYVFSSLDQKMGQMEMMDFLLHVKEKKTTPEKYRRFLLTTSAGGLSKFFINNPKYSEKFNDYLLEAKNRNLKKFTEEILKNPALFGLSVPQDASQERLSGIAGDFQLGASGMLLKYLLIFYGVSVGLGYGINAGTKLLNKNNDDPEAKDKKLTEGEKTLQEALSKKYSDENFEKAVSGLGLTGIVSSKFIKYFNRKDEAGKLNGLKTAQKKDLFEKLKEGNWGNEKIPVDDLLKFKEKQDKFWQLVGTVKPDDNVKKIRYGELGKFERAKVTHESKDILKTEKKKAYLNLVDLFEIKKAFEASGNNDSSSGMSLWQMIKNPPKLIWRKTTKAPANFANTTKELFNRVNRRTKINKMKGLWKGEQGILLGNMQVLGVPDFMLRDLEQKPKEEKMKAIYKLAEEVKGMYESGGTSK